jgi:hypothetical protein
MPGPGGLVAGGADGVGHPVVLAGLPDDRARVVLAAIVDGHPDAKGQGSLALGDVAVADAVSAVGGDAEGGVQPIKGLLGAPLGHSVVIVNPVVGVQLDGRASALEALAAPIAVAESRPRLT